MATNPLDAVNPDHDSVDIDQFFLDFIRAIGTTAPFVSRLDRNFQEAILFLPGCWFTPLPEMIPTAGHVEGPTHSGHW